MPNTVPGLRVFNQHLVVGGNNHAMSQDMLHSIFHLGATCYSREPRPPETVSRESQGTLQSVHPLNSEGSLEGEFFCSEPQDEAVKLFVRVEPVSKAGAMRTTALLTATLKVTVGKERSHGNAPERKHPAPDARTLSRKACDL